MKARGLTDKEIESMNEDFEEMDDKAACRIIVESGNAILDMGEKDGGEYTKLLF